MNDKFKLTVDACFGRLGRDATYTPADGAPVAVKVMPRRPDRIVGFEEASIHSETAVFDVRASEVATLRAGDTITVDNETFVVQGEPRREDPDRLVWTLDTRPA